MIISRKTSRQLIGLSISSFTKKLPHTGSVRRVSVQLITRMAPFHEFVALIRHPF